MSSALAGCCPERVRLLDAYREAARRYSEAVNKLADLAGTGLESEFDVLRRACRAGWETAEKTRLALFRHEADHFCDRPLWEKSKAAGAG